MNDMVVENETRLELTADIVSAYVSNNPVPTTDLPSLIADVNAALVGLGQPAEQAPVLTPAVNPKKSVFPDYIVSLEDGRKFKSLRRHLGLLGMTPDEYRSKWGLPRDYPMVSPNYTATRSALAKKLGLGRRPKVQPEPVAPVKRGRKPKATA
ncbi:MAG: MucR family transcriptional regulator [Mesorhizobium sp.]